MKARVVVAHPDDCIIYASAYMNAHREYEWSIVYLTCHYGHKRAREISKYWSRRGVETTYLGFLDDAQDLREQKLITWREEDAIEELQLAVGEVDLILTHNEFGEYGHPHHQVVHKAMQSVNIPKVYFSLNKEDIEYPMYVVLAELPRHRESIKIHAADGVARYKIG